MPRVHAPSEKLSWLALCGKRHVMMADPGDKVTCGHCMRKLGLDPDGDLDKALDKLATEWPNPKGHTLEQVVKAWKARNEYRAGRRYYRG